MDTKCSHLYNNICIVDKYNVLFREEMIMKKRICMLTLALTLSAATLVACGSNEAEENVEDVTTEAESRDADVDVIPAEEATDDTTTEDTEEAADDTTTEDTEAITDDTATEDAATDDTTADEAAEETTDAAE